MARTTWPVQPVTAMRRPISRNTAASRPGADACGPCRQGKTIFRSIQGYGPSTNEGEVSLSRTMVPLAESIDIIYKPNNLRVSLNAVQTLDSRMNLARLIPIPIRSQNSEICSLTQSEVTRFFISKIGGGSQIHTGGFIYRKYNQCPLIKRDLLYRDQFTINEIEEALIETGHEDHFDEIMTDFRKKGKASQLPIIKRLQAASGII
ncbi:hypothetical protein FQV39_14850 [Bosea sp. F3-2]|uniref:hypothetical protein n=1 Tax=Bosea sp. F3-2 TaxID=2599640 RepID=UPI0011EC930D|nr:hypothetical protein [Bosea sp. F3-2]QEL23722.1 hypothetical protein FQV39_14850 [Bosea sp. F3-2]